MSCGKCQEGVERGVEKEGTHLKEWMSSDDIQKTFQTFSSTLDDFIRETVGENFAWKRWNVDAWGLSFQEVTEGFKIRVTAADDGMT